MDRDAALRFHGRMVQPTRDADLSDAARLARRIGRFDWARIEADLDAVGFARLSRLVTAREALGLRRLFDHGERFRKTVDMDHHAYGSGDYRYFAAPLPPLVQTLREALYPPLAQVARGWAERLGASSAWPDRLDGYLAECASFGQTEPTPLLLRYGPGGYNRMHQDRYGERMFPFQVVCLLSRRAHAPGGELEPGAEFSGGPVLISEHRPRMQARVDAVDLELGEALVFAASERPVPSKRGWARATMRHGVGTVHAGQRTTLGLIFHDAAS